MTVAVMRNTRSPIRAVGTPVELRLTAHGARVAVHDGGIGVVEGVVARLPRRAPLEPAAVPMMLGGFLGAAE